MNTIKHDMEVKKLVKSLNNQQREVMETILRTVPTVQLQEGYDKFIGRIIKGTV